jgi:FAD/FMN-containing dehydrogenase
MQGHRGLLHDALLSVRMVTAEGYLITASETEHQDLFWALRGAGANFGIVVDATFRMYDMTNDGQATVIDLVFPAVANQSYYRTLETYGEDMPTNLALTAVAIYNREAGMVSTAKSAFQNMTLLF